MAIRGSTLIKRYSVPLVYRDTQQAVGSDSPFDNDPTTTEVVFTKVVAKDCTIQAPKKDDLTQMDSGYAEEKVKRIFTNTFVPSLVEGSDMLPALFYIPDTYFTLNPAYPARVGGWYKVLTVRPRLNNTIEHYEVLVVRADDLPDNEVPDVTSFDSIVTTRQEFIDSSLWETTWLT